ncbi:SusC/RagA family TonB-linked outer membrane protein [Paradesertivirga mongoliensis]|uniref:SusC/RagA family TonB-linked outer membrane protein n=1 Tax=Paradesertivirga mongoliensis TaxID=2100740 RepID=A0ABW4ZQS3_9SPHI|nr:SusC/RagA family TonB-linked outer membrane protein [Pedobacter mongoliensis]
MNFSKTQYYLSRGSRIACTPLLIAIFLSGTSQAETSSKIGVTLGAELKDALRDNITGKVTDSQGEPLPGVTVKIKGTTTATVTDVEGVFRLNLPTGNETLVFSYLGFQTMEVAVKGQTSFDVKLKEDVTALSQVIITGYGGTTTKGASTGAIDNLDAAEIEDLPLGNLGAALASRMLGLSVSGGTSRPGSTAQLTIRNPLTLSKDGSNSPLYIIDDVIQVDAQGVPDNTLFNNLDPSEVESISILKDAAAAIYGSRAANGAVIVQTKRGKIGKPRVSYSSSFAINDEAYRTKMLTGYEFAQYMNIRNGAYGSNRIASSPGDVKYVFTAEELEHYKNNNYDWLDDAWTSASNMRHTFNVSGGADKSTYFANIAYYTQDGNLGSLDYNKWTFRAGADVNVLSNLKAGLQVSGTFDGLTKTFNKIGGEQEENDYRNLLRAPQYIPYYVDGLPVKLPGTDALSRYNYYAITDLNNLATGDDRTTTFNLYAEYELPFIKGLKARASYARNIGSSRGTQTGTWFDVYDYGTAHIIDSNTPRSKKSYENGNRLYFSNRHFLSYQANLSANYTRQFGQHNVSGFFTVERSEAESSQEDVWRYDPTLTTNGQLNTAFGEYEGKSAGNESGTLGYVGRAHYDFANKYLADLVFRSDASTKFAPENYWGRFYSAALGWVVSEESFFKVPAVDFLKLRYSVGLLGRDDTKPWLWRQRYSYQQGKGGVFGDDDSNPASIGMKMEASPNRDATWSDEFKQNLGLDARFLNSRLSTTIEAFYNKGTNMLIERTANVPVTVGGSVASVNFGAVDFFGYEIGLGWNDNIGKDFRYGIDTRFSWYDNKQTKGNFNDNDAAYPWRAQPGKSTDIGQWGYDYLGMFRSQAEIDAYVQQYNITEVHDVEADNLKPGMLYYRDVRGPLQSDGTFAPADGIIDDNDQVLLAKRADNHYGFGITLRFGYKGFSFDSAIGGSFGGWSEIDSRKPLNQDISRIYQSVPAYWNDIYDPELNPNGKYPNPHNEDISLEPTSEFWRVSSFRMRMRNFNLNYSLPKKISDKLHVKNARVVFTGVNPINFYNPFDYKDSEGSWDAFPALRTFSLGINLSL